MSNRFEMLAFGLHTKLFQSVLDGREVRSYAIIYSPSYLTRIVLKSPQQSDQICLVSKMQTFNTLHTLYILKSEPMINEYVERMYRRGLSISSLPMLECDFCATYKWFLVNVRMTHGNIWGENNLFVGIELYSVKIACNFWPNR